MKFFISALALALTTTSVNANETWKIFSNNAWEVFYNAPVNGKPFCAASTVFENGQSIGFMNYGKGPMIQLYIDGSNFDGIRGKADIWVDNFSYWTGSGIGVGNSIFFDNVHGELIVEMWQGKRIYVDLDQDGYSDTSFSLSGSAKAFSALAECMRRL